MAVVEPSATLEDTRFWWNRKRRTDNISTLMFLFTIDDVLSGDHGDRERAADRLLRLMSGMSGVCRVRAFALSSRLYQSARDMGRP